MSVGCRWADRLALRSGERRWSIDARRRHAWPRLRRSRASPGGDRDARGRRARDRRRARRRAVAAGGAPDGHRTTCVVSDVARRAAGRATALPGRRAGPGGHGRVAVSRRSRARRRAARVAADARAAARPIARSATARAGWRRQRSTVPLRPPLARDTPVARHAPRADGRRGRRARRRRAPLFGQRGGRRSAGSALPGDAALRLPARRSPSRGGRSRRRSSRSHRPRARLVRIRRRRSSPRSLALLARSLLALGCSCAELTRRAHAARRRSARARCAPRRARARAAAAWLCALVGDPQRDRLVARDAAFQMPDEQSHYAYAEYVAAARAPAGARRRPTPTRRLAGAALARPATSTQRAPCRTTAAIWSAPSSARARRATCAQVRPPRRQRRRVRGRRRAAALLRAAGDPLPARARARRCSTGSR